MSVEIDLDNSDDIRIYEGDEPEYLAEEFVYKNNLNVQIIPLLSNSIKM